MNRLHNRTHVHGAHALPLWPEPPPACGAASGADADRDCSACAPIPTTCLRFQPGGEGFENKLAELMARTWNSKLEYVWWAAPRGIMRMLNGIYCDVSHGDAGPVRHGRRHPALLPTSYVIVQRKDAPHQVDRCSTIPRSRQ